MLKTNCSQVRKPFQFEFHSDTFLYLTSFFRAQKRICVLMLETADKSSSILTHSSRQSNDALHNEVGI